MTFLEWCQQSERWWFHAWANDRRCRLSSGTPESAEAYAEAFTRAGYGSYLDRLKDDSAWGDYLRSTGGGE